ncbi:hypothetical protein CfE428DRAFT_0716 [Chthoniobacter flavus Ellin428]|uniref:Uncharacterized protein n=1 Tax=Chthoniobacter flavus Ellin428 TaxID=497964 RepID=B4CVM9_9BACT|nr:hypothetical protein CfE428DRAFT_0716 [Chthoniobacter flavus Ellin428]TCO95425.1 hypothetical protein EV701_101112 [Chthoniobacter flavus]
MEMEMRFPLTQLVIAPRFYAERVGIRFLLLHWTISQEATKSTQANAEDVDTFTFWMYAHTWRSSTSTS